MRGDTTPVDERQSCTAMPSPRVLGRQDGEMAPVQSNHNRNPVQPTLPVGDKRSIACDEQYQSKASHSLTPRMPEKRIKHENECSPPLALGHSHSAPPRSHYLHSNPPLFFLHLSRPRVSPSHYPHPSLIFTSGQHSTTRAARDPASAAAPRDCSAGGMLNTVTRTTQTQPHRAASTVTHPIHSSSTTTSEAQATAPNR